MDRQTLKRISLELFYYGTRLVEALNDAMKELREVKFRSPVHAPALDGDGCYHDIMIESLKWRENGRDWIATDDTGRVWVDDDFLPCIHNKLVEEMIEQGLYSPK